jgi:rubrerythrin
MMAITFNSDEIFEMAEQIERNAAGFYREAAKRTGDKVAQKLYLQTMADSHGTEGKKSRTEKLTGKESMREIFEIAVAAEKDSVVFYTALKELVAPGVSRDKVETIIEEELGHLALLKLQLASLKQG